MDDCNSHVNPATKLANEERHTRHHVGTGKLWNDCPGCQRAMDRIQASLVNVPPDAVGYPNLPAKLRELFVCDLGPGDHGHTLCFFVSMAADEIERLSAGRP